MFNAILASLLVVAFQLIAMGCSSTLVCEPSVRLKSESQSQIILLPGFREGLPLLWSLSVSKRRRIRIHRTALRISSSSTSNSASNFFLWLTSICIFLASSLFIPTVFTPPGLGAGLDDMVSALSAKEKVLGTCLHSICAVNITHPRFQGCLAPFQDT